MKPDKNFNISFEENARRNKEILANQTPVTIEQARAQVKWLKEKSKVNDAEKKNRIELK